MALSSLLPHPAARKAADNATRTQTLCLILLRIVLMRLVTIIPTSVRPLAHSGAWARR
jgi:hypothetical protein